MTAVRWQGEDVFLNCHVQPGAKVSEFAGLHGDALKVRIAAQAQEGKANASLRRFLADAFGVPLSAVELVSGETSRQKRWRVIAPQRYPESLREWLDR